MMERLRRAEQEASKLREELAAMQQKSPNAADAATATEEVRAGPGRIAQSPSRTVYPLTLVCTLFILCNPSPPRCIHPAPRPRPPPGGSTART
jgi:hypothetical protein